MKEFIVWNPYDKSHQFADQNRTSAETRFLIQNEPVNQDASSKIKPMKEKKYRQWKQTLEKIPEQIKKLSNKKNVWFSKKNRYNINNE